jgi:(S)-mandelate dehydrogenase
MLKSEIDTTLAQIGCPAVTQLTSDYIWSAESATSQAMGDRHSNEPLLSCTP